MREVGEDAHGENGGGGPPPLKFEAYYDFVSQVRYTCMYSITLTCLLQHTKYYRTGVRRFTRVCAVNHTHSHSPHTRNHCARSLCVTHSLPLSFSLFLSLTFGGGRQVASRFQQSRMSVDTASMLASSSMRSVGRQTSALEASLGGGEGVAANKKQALAGGAGLRSQSAGSLRHYKDEASHVRRRGSNASSSSSTVGGGGRRRKEPEADGKLRRRPTTASGAAAGSNVSTGSRSGGSGRRRSRGAGGGGARLPRPATAPSSKAVQLTPIVAEEWVTAMDPKK